MLLPFTWQRRGGSAGKETGPALSPCPCPRPCPIPVSVPSRPAAAPTQEQLYVGSLAGTALLPPQTGPVQPRTAGGERRSPVMLACAGGRRAVFIQPHIQRWMAPQWVAWGKCPVFAQGCPRGWEPHRVPPQRHWQDGTHRPVRLPRHAVALYPNRLSMTMTPKVPPPARHSVPAVPVSPGPPVCPWHSVRGSPGRG